jgi:nucleoside-diphosphate-sugar epimerase
MNILLVGGSSKLAKVLKPRLESYATVITAGREDCDITLDLSSDCSEIKFPHNIDVLIHLAASFGGSDLAGLSDAIKVNVLGLSTLFELASRSGVSQILYVSTIFACLDESSSYYSSYALTKRQGEQVARMASELVSIPLTIIRPSQIYGDSDDFRIHQPFLYYIIDRAEKGEDISIFGSRASLRNYIHVDDVCEAIERLVLTKHIGTFSVNFPEDISYETIAQIALAAWGRGGSVYYLKDKPDIPDNVFSLTADLYRLINWTPQIDMVVGIERIVTGRKRIA